jgi:major intracellular serine protease
MAHFKLPPFKVQETLNPAEIPWGVKYINAPSVWDKAKGKDVVVAVLDTGVDKTHSDLKDRVIDGRNFTTDYNGDATNYSDNNGHGTHCAGTIGATIDNNGVAGVAPEVKIIAGKVLAGNGSGDYDGIIAGIKWATNWVGPNGETVRVISMSLGGPYDVSALYKAIKAAITKGISVVCAAGNEGDGNSDTSEYSYPGAYQEVIEVGAIDSFGQVAKFSNTNDKLDVVAPGVDIISTAPNGRWAKMSGTSMATPHVAGAIALLISAYETEDKKLTEAEIFDLLIKNTKTLSFAKNAVGKGVIDFSIAGYPVDEPVEPEPQPEPQPEPEQPATPSEPAEEIEFEGNIVSKADLFYVNVGPYKTLEEAKVAFTKVTVKALS